MLTDLDPKDRLRLMKFVCSFAWADLEVRPEERAFVQQLAQKLGLSDEEQGRVEEWLRVPPRPEEVDPAKIPRAHRELFYAAAKSIVEADHDVAAPERETLELFRQLLV